MWPSALFSRGGPVCARSARSIVREARPRNRYDPACWRGPRPVPAILSELQSDADGPESTSDVPPPPPQISNRPSSANPAQRRSDSDCF